MLRLLKVTALGLALGMGSMPVGVRPVLAQQAAAPTPAALAAAKELLSALGSDKQLEAMIPMLMQNMRQLVLQQKPGQQKELDEAFKVLETKFSARRMELIDEVAVTYAALVPLDDMKAMTAFFLSPAGKRFVAMQPQLMRESMAVGQRWGEKLGREVEVDLQQELKKRGVTP